MYNNKNNPKNKKKRKKMRNETIINGYFFVTNGNEFTPGSLLKKGLEGLFLEKNALLQTLQKSNQKEQSFVVHVQVCKKQTYSMSTRRGTFAIKVRSGAEIVSVVPFSSLNKKETVKINVPVAMPVASSVEK